MPRERNRERNRERKRKNLNKLNPGEEAKILSTPQKPVLNALGLRPGKKIKTEAKQPFQGPILASVKGRKIAIDQEIANDILIRW